MGWIVVTVAAMLLVFALWVGYCYSRCPRTAVILTSAEVIIPFIYVVYASVAPLLFAVEGSSLADSYFYISRATMLKTSQIYLFVLAAFILLMLFTGRADALASRQLDWASHYQYGDFHAFFDLPALGIIVYMLLKLSAASGEWATLDSLGKRAAVGSSVVQYLYIYMVAYSLKSMVPALLGAQKLKLYRLLLVAMFWALYLGVTVRRYFLMFLPALLLAAAARGRGGRLKARWIVLALAAALLLLTVGARRAGLSLTADSAVYYLHGSLAEFIYTYYVSCYFVAVPFQPLYGSSYVLDTLTKWVPRALFPQKPLDLSERFWQMAGTNVAYSFNPVAEGLWNFRWGCLVAVPLLLYLYLWIANYAVNYSPLLYMAYTGYFISFMRGGFSNAAMDMAMLTAIIAFMNVRNLKIPLYYRPVSAPRGTGMRKTNERANT